ncbi:hypothetical protein ACET3Z_029076 [Daucus carota]
MELSLQNINTIKVPLDAYMMDFVFSEREDGGVFDNKLGMDYHIPVFGGIAKEPPMHIVHIAVEMAPIAKKGSQVYQVKEDTNKMDGWEVEEFHFHKSYFWGGTEIKVWFGKVEGLFVYFLEPQNGLFWTGCIYGCKNDGDRFGFFCHAALEYLLQSGSNPDIIHCHDWSSAPVAWLFKDHYMHYGVSKARVVFTIHNLEFGAHLIGKAMAYVDKATTVSPTYSQEVSGNPAISPHLNKFHDILNGIDPDIWDPYNDKVLPVCHTSENVFEGKRAAKEALQQKLGLKRVDLPLVGIITRLTHQKGIHLIKHAICRTLDRGRQVVLLLGSAPDPRIQNDFVNMASHLHSSHNDRARLYFILVPSIFEPCGLTQLTAMRYGSIPIVHKTGGLYDTVFDVDHDKERAQARGLEPNGFNFEGADAAGVDYAVNRAISAWYDGRDWFNSLCKLVMEQDWSWNRPAKQDNRKPNKNHYLQQIFSSSPNDGSKVRVAYQGVPGAYSEAAALKAYPKCETVPCDQFEAAFKVLDQCEMTLNKLGVVRVNYDDTAGAAQVVAADRIRDTGAVASSRAAEIYGLDILAEGMQDQSDDSRGPVRVVDDSNKGSVKYFDYLFYTTLKLLWRSLVLNMLRDICRSLRSLSVCPWLLSVDTIL